MQEHHAEGGAGAGLRILFADALPQGAVDELESRGHECVVDSGLGGSDLPDHIAGYDVLVVRSTKVNARVFAAADRLALVIRAGAGTNTIDTSAAASRGVLVANVPGRNSAAVAELTMGLLIAVDRRLADNVADLRAGRWNKKLYGKASGLLGSTMGIIGLGSIGLGVAERAAAFGIKVQTVAKPREASVEARAAELGITMVDSLEELVATSDIISLHVPASPETKQLVDKAFLHRMRPGAILLNTSRGDVVDETALLEALDAGTVRAGLDVYADEPGSGRADWESALARHPGVVGTHHIGASTQQAQLATAAGVVEIVEAFTEGQARNCVNLEPSRLGSVTLTVRHLDRPGVLARVLDALSEARLNVEHMENRVFRGGEAAVASIDVAGSVSSSLITEIGAIGDVLGVSATRFDGATGEPDEHADDDPAGRSVVRPLTARLVRQEFAEQNISRMLDALPASERSQARRTIDPAAYDEPTAALYVYGLRRGDDEHVGVVGEVSVEAFVDGQVRGHEAVQPQRVDGLVDHYASDGVSSELVALLRPDGSTVEDAIAESRRSDPVIRFIGPDGWEQTVWRVPDAITEALADELSRGVHYIADGHHRVAAGLSMWRDADRPSGAGLMCVIYPPDGLRLLAFHRRVAGPVDADALLAQLSGAFEVREVAHAADATGSFALYVAGHWYDAAFTGERPAGARGLDIAVLNEHVLEPLLGATGATARLEITSALSPLEELTRACDDDGGALFALRPPTLDQLTEVADRGEVMPPKTTYFDPKPYAGIFVR